MANDPVGGPLEPSPTGRRWPTVRQSWARVLGGPRARDWVWLLSMLWVVFGAGGAIYATVALSHPGYSEVLLIPPTIEWPGEPQLIIDAAPIAEVTWGLLLVPVLVAGFVRLGSWRPRNWLRAAAWASSWMAGLALMIQSRNWVAAGLGGTLGVLSVGEIASCVAWLVLGSLMTWILAVPPARRLDAERPPANEPAARPNVGEKGTSVPKFDHAMT